MDCSIPASLILHKCIVYSFAHVIHSKSPTCEPSSCKLSKMQMYYQSIPVQYYIANCISWVPRLTLQDLTNALPERNSMVCRELTVCMRMLSHFSRVQLFVTLWTVAHWAPLSMGLSRQEYWSWVAMPSARGSSWPSDRICLSYISCRGRWVFTTSAMWEAHRELTVFHIKKAWVSREANRLACWFRICRETLWETRQEYRYGIVH